MIWWWVTAALGGTIDNAQRRALVSAVDEQDGVHRLVTGKTLAGADCEALVQAARDPAGPVVLDGQAHQLDGALAALGCLWAQAPGDRRVDLLEAALVPLVPALDEPDLPTFDAASVSIATLRTDAPVSLFEPSESGGTLLSFAELSALTPAVQGLSPGFGEHGGSGMVGVGTPGDGLGGGSTARGDGTLGQTRAIEVVGAHDPESLTQVIQRQLPGLTYCFARLELSTPASATLRAVVASDGNVQAVNIVDAVPVNPQLDACLSQRLRQLQFETAEGESVVTFGVEVEGE